MAVETTYTSLREELSAYFDQVVDDREIVIVKRRGAKDVALVAADELSSLMETAHLLRSPKNAERLFKAMRRAGRGSGKTESVESLRQSIGLEQAR